MKTQKTLTLKNSRGMLLLLTIAFALIFTSITVVPVFAADGDACTVTANCTGTYTNGICSVCKGNQPAEQNTDGYYEIGNAGQLLWFAQQVNSGNTAINGKLTDHIDMTDIEYIPIGTHTNIYKGIFDGNSKTVSGINYSATSNHDAADSSGSMHAGFFGTIGGAQVKNLAVEGSFTVDYTGTNADVNVYVGGIVGYADSQTNDVIENCSFVGSVSANGYNIVIAGGIVGWIGYDNQISNCFAAASVSASGQYDNGANAYAGAVAGVSYPSVTYTNNYYNGTLCATEIGKNHASTAAGIASTTTAQFASGEVAYLLGSPWGQTIDSDSYPVLGGVAVYQAGKCSAPTYSNTNSGLSHDETLSDAYYQDGKCIYCGAQNIVYLDANGVSQTCIAPTKITDQTTLTSGWYYVDDAVTISDSIAVNGDVHLILCDDASLTANSGICVNSSKSLTIYGQHNGTGKLVANGIDKSAAGIELRYNDDTTLTINGGVIEARGDSYYPGIGGLHNQCSGRVIINGGEVTAVGGSQSAGIGAAFKGHTIKVTINGGTVTATKGDGAIADIGYGNGSSGENQVIITGGSVNAGINISDYSPINGIENNTPIAFLTKTEIIIPSGKTVADLLIKNADGSNYPYNGRDMKPDADGKLYLWLPANVTAGFYTVTFYDSDDTTTLGVIAAVPGDAVNGYGIPGKENSVFLGWNPSLPETMPSENISVIAQWATNTNGDGIFEDAEGNLYVPDQDGDGIAEKVTDSDADGVYEGENGDFYLPDGNGNLTKLTDAEGDGIYEDANGKKYITAAVVEKLTQELEEAVRELEIAISEQVDPVELQNAIDNVQAQINGLDDNYATDDAVAEAIEQARSEITDAYMAAIQEAKNALYDEINESTRNDALELAKAVAELKTLIDGARTYAETQDAALKAELESEIAEANALIASLETRVTTAEQAIEAVEQAIEQLKAVDTSNAQALADAITTLNDAIEDAKLFATGADTALETKLEAAIADAIAASEAAIKDWVNGELEQPLKDIAALQSDLNALTSSAATDAELAAAVAAQQTALEQAKNALTAAYEKAIEDAINENNGQISEDIAAAVKTAQDNLQAQIDTITGEIEKVKARLDINEADINSINQQITAINTSIGNLQNAINSGATDLSAEIVALNEALTNAKAALESADVTLGKQLADAIDKAENELATAVSALEDKITEEVGKLQNQINANDTDIDSINASITTINGLIDALKAADVTLGGDITDAVEKAENELKTVQDELKGLIGNVQSNLDDAKAELEKAIADGDADLSTEIANLNTALAEAKAALEQADTDNKAELVKKIEDAQTTLQAAIDKVASDLAQAKTDLQNAIDGGDKTLDDKISALNTALDNAKAALEATDAANKADLEEQIANAKSSLRSSINTVQNNLDEAVAALEQAIANGDNDLSGRISALNTALDNAISAYQAADGSLKSELTTKIEAADATLDAAIKAVQKNLDDAKAELNKAIADGDTELDGKIAALNDALASAKAALEAADTANKTELTTKIDEADAALQAAIDALSNELNNVKNELGNVKSELESKDSELQTFIIIVCVISGVALCGSGAFIVWFFIDRKKRI